MIRLLKITNNAKEAIKFLRKKFQVFNGRVSNFIFQGGCDETTFTSADMKTCHFSGRLDIFKHFVVGGGYWGAKETVNKLFSSIFSFINYYPEAVKEERIKKLFENETYKKKINNICKDGLKAGGNVPDGDVSFRPTQVYLHDF